MSERFQIQVRRALRGQRAVFDRSMFGKFEDWARSHGVVITGRPAVTWEESEQQKNTSTGIPVG